MQTFELLPEHRFSPNNIHAFTISEPCILPVFCKAIQAVRYKPLKHLYIQLTHLFDCYIYTFIYILREYRQDIDQNFHLKWNPTATPLCHFIFLPPPPSIPGPFLCKIMDPQLLMSHSYNVKFILLGKKNTSQKLFFEFFQLIVCTGSIEEG